MPWVLGDTFLRTVVPVFDIANLRVGLAPRAGYGPGLPSTKRRYRADARAAARSGWSKIPLLPPAPAPPFCSGTGFWSWLARVPLWQLGLVSVAFGCFVGAAVAPCLCLSFAGSLVSVEDGESY